MKLFLSHHGKSDKGKKEELIQRVEAIFSQHAVTPDEQSDSHPQQPEQQQQQQQQQQLASSQRTFPSTGWTSLEDICASSSVGMLLLMPYVMQYLIARKAVDGLDSADFRSLSEQSDGLCKRAYARNGAIAVIPCAEELLFKCNVRATMKTGVRYAVKMVLKKESSQSFNTIVYTECGCPAGAAPNSTCKHIAAVCYGLDEFSRFGSFTGCTSSTSELCKWNAPPSKRLVSQMDFTAPQPESERTRPTAGKKHRLLHDPRPSDMQDPDSTVESRKLFGIVGSNTRPAAARPALLDLLSPVTSTVSSIRSSAVQPTRTSTTVYTVRELADLVHASEAFKGSNKDQCSILKLCDRFRTLLALSPQQIHALEYRTRGQASNALWMEHRFGRLTASIFSSVVKRKGPFGPLVIQMLNRKPFHSPAADWGRQNEAIAQKDYVKKCSVLVAQRGLMVMANGFTGASPDGLVNDSSLPAAQQQGLLEIKCPYSARHITPADACEVLDNFFCKLDDDGTFSLKRNHNFYFQACRGLQDRQHVLLQLFTALLLHEVLQAVSAIGLGKVYHPVTTTLKSEFEVWRCCSNHFVLFHCFYCASTVHVCNLWDMHV
ncbi:uncharacterized protein LOC135824690 [Sycon ciliatum]|uniref:uncharacterized protein LOC135824690 n=1 Tax=Sycon ciliatum TaxID=27933 RepID=UPI0031F69701